MPEYRNSPTCYMSENHSCLCSVISLESQKQSGRGHDCNRGGILSSCPCNQQGPFGDNGTILISKAIGWGDSRWNVELEMHTWFYPTCNSTQSTCILLHTLTQRTLRPPRPVLHYEDEKEFKKAWTNNQLWNFNCEDRLVATVSAVNCNVSVGVCMFTRLFNAH